MAGWSTVAKAAFFGVCMLIAGMLCYLGYRYVVNKDSLITQLQTNEGILKGNISKLQTENNRLGDENKNLRSENDTLASSQTDQDKDDTKTVEKEAKIENSVIRRDYNGIRNSPHSEMLLDAINNGFRRLFSSTADPRDTDSGTNTIPDTAQDIPTTASGIPAR